MNERPPIVVPVDHFERVMAALMEQMEEHARRSREIQAQAIADGIRATVTDPDVVRAVMDQVATAAQQRATEAAGRGVWWVLKSAISRWLVIGAIVLLTAKAFGWDVAGKVSKFLTGATS